MSGAGSNCRPGRSTVNSKASFGPDPSRSPGPCCVVVCADCLTRKTALDRSASGAGRIVSGLMGPLSGIAALWLYLFVARQPLRLPAADVAVVSSGGTTSAQSVA
jgi:hypothetical protein